MQCLMEKVHDGAKLINVHFLGESSVKLVFIII